MFRKAINCSIFLVSEFVAGSGGQYPFTYFFCMKIILYNICAHCVVNPDPFFRPLFDYISFVSHKLCIFSVSLHVIDYNIDYNFINWRNNFLCFVILKWVLIANSFNRLVMCNDHIREPKCSISNYLNMICNLRSWDVRSWLTLVQKW